MTLAEKVYPLIRQLPADERYALGSQIRRAVTSIPANIAEGKGYGTNRRYVHHLRIACGSEAELQTQLELVVRLGFAKHEQVAPLLARTSEVGKMLNGLIRSLDRAHDSGKNPPDPDP